jgi:antitoxin YefM
MVEMIHRREEDWAEPPFTSLTPLADFVNDFCEIVREAMPDPPRKISAQVSYDHGSTGWLSPQELKEAASDLEPLAEIKRFHAISGFVHEDGPKESPDDSGFQASIYISPWSSTTLAVEGRKLTAVEGVFGAAKAAIDRSEKERRRAEREADLKEEERQRQAENVARLSPSPFRRRLAVYKLVYTPSMAKMVPVRELRRNLSSLLDDVSDRRDHVLVTRNGSPAAALIPIDEYEALEETAEILSDPDALSALEVGLGEIERGETITFADLRSELAESRPTAS